MSQNIKPCRQYTIPNAIQGSKFIYPLMYLAGKIFWGQMPLFQSPPTWRAGALSSGSNKQPAPMRQLPDDKNTSMWQHKTLMNGNHDGKPEEFILIISTSCRWALYSWELYLMAMSSRCPSGRRRAFQTLSSLTCICSSSSRPAAGPSHCSPGHTSSPSERKNEWINLSFIKSDYLT